MLFLFSFVIPGNIYFISNSKKKNLIILLGKLLDLNFSLSYWI